MNAFTKWYRILNFNDNQKHFVKFDIPNHCIFKSFKNVLELSFLELFVQVHTGLKHNFFRIFLGKQNWGICNGILFDFVLDN